MSNKVEKEVSKLPLHFIIKFTPVHSVKVGTLSNDNDDDNNVKKQ